MTASIPHAMVSSSSETLWRWSLVSGTCPCLTAGCSLLAGHVLQAVLDWCSLLVMPLPFLVHEVDDNTTVGRPLSSSLFWPCFRARSIMIFAQAWHSLCFRPFDSRSTITLSPDFAMRCSSTQRTILSSTWEMSSRHSSWAFWPQRRWWWRKHHRLLFLWWWVSPPTHSFKGEWRCSSFSVWCALLCMLYWCDDCCHRSWAQLPPNVEQRSDGGHEPWMAGCHPDLHHVERSARMDFYICEGWGVSSFSWIIDSRRLDSIGGGASHPSEFMSSFVVSKPWINSVWQWGLLLSVFGIFLTICGWGFSSTCCAAVTSEWLILLRGDNSFPSKFWGFVVGFTSRHSTIGWRQWSSSTFLIIEVVVDSWWPPASCLSRELEEWGEGSSLSIFFCFFVVSTPWQTSSTWWRGCPSLSACLIDCRRDFSSRNDLEVVVDTTTSRFHERAMLLMLLAYKEGDSAVWIQSDAVMTPFLVCSSISSMNEVNVAVYSLVEGSLPSSTRVCIVDLWASWLTCWRESVGKSIDLHISASAAINFSRFTLGNIVDIGRTMLA